MKEYIYLLEEYLCWAEIQKTSAVITTQLFNSSLALPYKVSLLKCTLIILRNDFPDTWQRLQFARNVDLKSATGH